MTSTFLIILGLILIPIGVVFVRGFIEGYRSYQKPKLTPEELRQLWYDMVYEREPKPKQKYRVIWPDNDDGPEFPPLAFDFD